MTPNRPAVEDGQPPVQAEPLPPFISRQGVSRLLLLLTPFVLLAALAALFGPRLGAPLRPLVLPLRDRGLIRDEARREGLEPALVAALIYAETKFAPRTSAAGAVGLMQVERQTAASLARSVGAPPPTTRELEADRTNLAYGCRYLAQLLRAFGGSKVVALAAYNAGPTTVKGWIKARGGKPLTPAALPYPATRAYVERVLAAAATYRKTYGQGLTR